MKEKKRPYMQFYCSDWRADPRLRMCSLAARGLWIDLISYMHEGEPYGHFTIDGVQPDLNGIAALVARPQREVTKALAELEARQVFSRTDNGIIFSRRMVRDKAKADRDRENGKGGGNPNLASPDKGGVNPPDKAPDKAHILETRKENAAPNGAHAQPNEDADLFKRGKAILGEDAGGLISKLKRAKGGSVSLARAAIEQAATKENPREYIGRVIAGPQKTETVREVVLTPRGTPWPEGIT